MKEIPGTVPSPTLPLHHSPLPSSHHSSQCQRKPNRYSVSVAVLARNNNHNKLKRVLFFIEFLIFFSLNCHFSHVLYEGWGCQWLSDTFSLVGEKVVGGRTGWQTICFTMETQHHHKTFLSSLGGGGSVRMPLNVLQPCPTGRTRPTHLSFVVALRTPELLFSVF